MSEVEAHEFDMKILGFKTTERIDGEWHSLLWDIRNYGEEDEEEEEEELCRSCGEDCGTPWMDRCPSEDTEEEEEMVQECLYCREEVKEKDWYECEKHNEEWGVFKISCKDCYDKSIDVENLC